MEECNLELEGNFNKNRILNIYNNRKYKFQKVFNNYIIKRPDGNIHIEIHGN